MSENTLPYYKVRMFRDKYVLMGECISELLGKREWTILDLADYMVEHRLEKKE